MGSGTKSRTPRSMTPRSMTQKSMTQKSMTPKSMSRTSAYPTMTVSSSVRTTPGGDQSQSQARSMDTEMAICPHCKESPDKDDGSITLRVTKDNLEQIVRLMKQSSRRKPVHVRCGTQHCNCAYHYLKNGKLCCARVSGERKQRV